MADLDPLATARRLACLAAILAFSHCGGCQDTAGERFDERDISADASHENDADDGERQPDNEVPTGCEDEGCHCPYLTTDECRSDDRCELRPASRQSDDDCWESIDDVVCLGLMINCPNNITFAEDEEGRCWRFSDGEPCVPQRGFEYSSAIDKRCGGAADVSCP